MALSRSRKLVIWMAANVINGSYAANINDNEVKHLAQQLADMANHLAGRKPYRAFPSSYNEAESIIRAWSQTNWLRHPETPGINSVAEQLMAELQARYFEIM